MNPRNFFSSRFCFFLHLIDNATMYIYLVSMSYIKKKTQEKQKFNSNNFNNFWYYVMMNSHFVNNSKKGNIVEININ